MDTQFLGLVDYLPTYEAMQVFTASRTHVVDEKSNENTSQSKHLLLNQLWICEHSPVFTQGLAGKADHLLLPGNIPVVQTNRGGQVTYHGPGQVVAYPLIDLKAAGYYVKEYVFKIEEAVIKTLTAFNITGSKLLTLGLIICVMGLAFGLMNDLEHPFKRIATTALALIALAGITYYARHIKPEERLARIGLSLILGGALGNLIDRVRQSYVIDFVDVYWKGWHFWAFNVADAAITIGAILVFVELLVVHRHASHSV